MEIHIIIIYGYYFLGNLLPCLFIYIFDIIIPYTANNNFIIYALLCK